MALPIENELYKKLEDTVKQYEIHAIYEPDSAGPFPDCYMAAVDLFGCGQTYKVYFRANEEHSYLFTAGIEVVHLERWWFG